MEGLYFYGFAWSTWIIATFILKKSSNLRLPIACIMLIALIISPYTVSIGEYSVSYVSILMIFIIFTRIGYFSIKKKLSYFITSLIISIGYVSFLLFELFDPIWVLFKREWMVAIIICFLSVLLQKKLAWRISIIITGSIYGDILFATIIHSFSFPYTIGSLKMLDVCSISAATLFGWEGLKLSIGYFESLYHTLEREKQKTT